MSGRKQHFLVGRKLPFKLFFLKQKDIEVWEKEGTGVAIFILLSFRNGDKNNKITFLHFESGKTVQNFKNQKGI